jgi:hypothetical protein
MAEPKQETLDEFDYFAKFEPTHQDWWERNFDQKTWDKITKSDTPFKDFSKHYDEGLREWYQGWMPGGPAPFDFLRTMFDPEFQDYQDVIDEKAWAEKQSEKQYHHEKKILKEDASAREAADWREGMRRSAMDVMDAMQTRKEELFQYNPIGE